MSVVTQKILIFGGTGSLGKKLISRLKMRNTISVYSRDEEKHWTIKNQLKSELSDASYDEHLANSRVKFIVGDIRDKDRVLHAVKTEKPSIVIIAAALKQVDTCELSPEESVKTNLVGTQNVIDAVNEFNSYMNVSSTWLGGVRKVLFVSTDKACAPVNVYGMCKSVSERLVTSQSAIDDGQRGCSWLCTRYGNVLESRGSIIPLFKYQAENSKYLTVTNPDMTRFVMTLDDSVDLIERTLENGKSGETWIPVLPAMKIGDLAEIFAEQHNKKVKIIGLRPGEKMHEDLLNESESVRTRETSVDGVQHYAISAAYKQPGKDSKQFTYSSNDIVMSKDELRKHLAKLGILEMPSKDFEGKSIEEIRTT